jgi:hypothetical protein
MAVRREGERLDAPRVARQQVLPFDQRHRGALEHLIRFLQGDALFHRFLRRERRVQVVAIGQMPPRLHEQRPALCAPPIAERLPAQRAERRAHQQRQDHCLNRSPPGPLPLPLAQRIEGYSDDPRDQL